jgi:hypothetical protein
MFNQEIENLKYDLAEKSRKIKHLEKDLRESIRNPYVNSNNISGSLGGGIIFAGIPLILIVNEITSNSESGIKLILGFLGGALAASIGAYSYHNSVMSHQEKRWKELDIGSHEIEKVTYWM